MSSALFKQIREYGIWSTNQSLVLCKISEQKDITRSGLANDLGVSKNTITSITKTLVKNRLIEIRYRKSRENNYGLTLKGLNLVTSMRHERGYSTQG